MVASYAYSFTWVLYFAVGFNMQFDCYRQYLNSTGRSSIVQFTNLGSLMLHLLWLKLFTGVWGLGYIGVAFAMLMTAMINFSTIAIYLWFIDG